MSMEDVEILIIPDVHGRSFWREPVKQYIDAKGESAKIVFLGDYVDPYVEDFPDDENYREKAFEMLNEIIDLKWKYPNIVTLLIGNHDCGYMFNPDICNHRMDRIRYAYIREVFRENKEQFDLAYEARINGKHIILSHAGISKVYAEYVFGDEVNEDNVVELFNTAYHNEDWKTIRSLGICDRYRVNYGDDFGSLVWTDVRTWFDNEDKDYGYGDYNIFAHTQLKLGCHGLFRENFADIDCREAFYINKLGELKRFSEINNEKND